METIMQVRINLAEKQKQKNCFGNYYLEISLFSEMHIYNLK